MARSACALHVRSLHSFQRVCQTPVYPDEGIMCVGNAWQRRMALWRREASALAATGQAAHRAVACGTLALLCGERAAEGQTARLSLGIAPVGEPHGRLKAKPQEMQQRRRGRESSLGLR